jgi:hypothetical protein
MATEAERQAIEVGLRFLTALFTVQDIVLFRPIETWAEGKQKRSRVIYPQTLYRAATPELLRLTLEQLLEMAVRERANLFFGTCPRFGAKYYDLAWQVRKVNALWADVDHATVEEALSRVKLASLPEPSIAVNSGSGAHLYWLQDHPYLIDDVCDPPKVLTRFLEVDGKKKPEKYFLDERGDEVLVSQKHLCPKLTAKAEKVQDILAGLAAKIGGDHTTDLSRLLRIPGSLNRKNERNSVEPKKTELLLCEPNRRYPISAFEHLVADSPTANRREQLQHVQLPTIKKQIAGRSRDALNAAITGCAIASKGQRSEADFALCCLAIERGVAQDALWSQVSGTGKFKECGREYFDRTWEAAAGKVKESILDKVQRDTIAAAIVGGQKSRQPASEARFDDGDAGADDGRTITVDPQSMPVGRTMSEITQRLLNAGNCFSRADQLVVVNGETIQSILSAPELAGLLNQHVEFLFVGARIDEYKPLPANYGNTWLHRADQRTKLSTITLFTRNPVYAKDWRLVTPGFDAGSGIYYAGPTVEPRNGTEHLDRLLQDFCFKSPADRTNYLGMLLTTVLMPHFIGAKPAILFNGNQPGLGKSILAQIIAALRDGHPTETVTYNPNDEEFEKRIAAIVRRGATTIIVDNAKGQGRHPRIESPCLERSITDLVLSFRLLGKTMEIRAENSHIFCITANSPDVSADLVSRSIVVHLLYEGDPKIRGFRIDDPEGYAQDHRIELLGELLGMVQRWKGAGMPLASTATRFNKRRWGNIVGGILEFGGEPDFLANAETAAAALDDTRREFSELVELLVDHPRGIWTPTELAEVCAKNGLLGEVLGSGTARSQSTKMGNLAGRYIDVTFDLPDGRQAAFRRSPDRKGNVYHVGVVEVPNLGAFAEPMPNLEKMAGSAP